jgi:sulfatase modifying factor 1
MVRVPANGQSFMMGFTAAEAGTVWACYVGKHKVTFTYDYCMDANLVSQAEYNKLMGNNPSQHTGDLTYPVDAVNWYDAALYCNERSKQDGLDPAYTYTSVTRSGNHATVVGLSYDIKKTGYRLATNAEYEYAERANTVGTYFFAATAPGDINSATGIGNTYTWNAYNSGGVSQPVGTKKPNPWGIYDLVGNVFEWENDWEGPYLTTDQVDPTGPAAGGTNCGDTTTAARKMAKGGSYKTDVKGHMRISYHYYWGPGSVTREMGFRCVNTLK